MRDWRAQHPRATLQEIEAELDSRLSGGRARLLEQIAQQSQAAAWSGRGVETEAPPCPHAGRRWSRAGARRGG